MPWKVWKSEIDKKWYYHVTGENGEILVDSEAYSRATDARRALRGLQNQVLRDVAGENEQAFIKK